jgi:hypothetical protein
VVLEGLAVAKMFMEALDCIAEDIVFVAIGNGVID